MQPLARRRLAGLLVALAAGLPAVLVAAPATATPVAQGTVVSAVPSTSTPEVLDGRVQALAQVGGAVVFGGTFTTVSDRSGPSRTQRYLGAYDHSTGRLLPGFAPALDGEVDALVAGPHPGTVLVGGTFTHLVTPQGSVTVPRLVELDLSTGLPVPGFTPPAINLPVRTMARSGDRLYLGGWFSSVGGQPHAGLATLSASTGALDPSMDLQVSDHHNYGHVAGSIDGPVGATALAVTPDGRQMTVIGNFRTVSGYARDQVVVVDLTGPRAQVQAGWATTLFTAPCKYFKFDSWVRSVDYAPDGSYFVIGSTGGGNKDLCDDVARFETGARGLDVRPTWVASTGGDSIYAVAATGSAVYAGGHFRWFNNPLANDRAGAGAVPRPGIVALDPRTGLPLTWNPGRHPRDKGLFALLATDTDIVIGTDTDWVGYRQYYEPRLASFPLAGGSAAPAPVAAALPGTLRRITTIPAGTVVVETPSDGTTVGTPHAAAPAPGFAGVRGVVVVDGRALLAGSDGVLRDSPWTRGHLGTRTVLDPYDDPFWSDILTGVGGPTPTYRGVPSGFEQDLPHLTSLFYLGGRLYYTVSGSPQLRSRLVETHTGITSPKVSVVAYGLPELAGGTYAAGAFWYVRSSDGALLRRPFDGTSWTGAAVVVSSPALDGQDWRSQALFVS